MNVNSQVVRKPLAGQGGYAVSKAVLACATSYLVVLIYSGAGAEAMKENAAGVRRSFNRMASALKERAEALQRNRV